VHVKAGHSVRRCQPFNVPPQRRPDTVSRRFSHNLIQHLNFAKTSQTSSLPCHERGVRVAQKPERTV
jgi:hypothetical protein